jgi:putative effector of murein hydrolase LrgA (UPF0299 family)
MNVSVVAMTLDTMALLETATETASTAAVKTVELEELALLLLPVPVAVLDEPLVV